MRDLPRTRVEVVDIENGLSDVDADGWDRRLSLLRLGHKPLSIVEQSEYGGVFSASALWQSIAEEHAWAVTSTALRRRLSAGDAISGDVRELLSDIPEDENHSNFRDFCVAIPTRRRPDDLRRCLSALAAGLISPETFDVIVVDNDDVPAITKTEALVTEFPWVRYVREKAPGASHARNAALAECGAEYIAYLDDDTIPDKAFASQLAAFCESGFEMGSGMVLPLKVETPAEHHFEQFGGFGRGTQTISATSLNDCPSPGQLGTGANMMFRADVLRSIGGFSSLFGTGSPMLGAEDLEVWSRGLHQGAELRYEPSVVVQHAHREDIDRLEAQLYSYGIGITAFHLRCMEAFPELRTRYRDLHVWWGRHGVLRPVLEAMTRPTRYPTRLRRAYARGYVRGHAVYARRRNEAP